MIDRVFRHEVPVDDAWHEIALTGPVVAVGCRDPGVVEFWAIDCEGFEPKHRRFIVVGTGHAIPGGATSHVGTATAPGGLRVWHLFESETFGWPRWR